MLFYSPVLEGAVLGPLPLGTLSWSSLGVTREVLRNDVHSRETQKPQKNLHSGEDVTNANILPMMLLPN